MKFAKIFLASFVLLAIASAFIAPKSHTKAPEKKFTTVDNELLWDGGNISGADFVLGSTSSSELSIAANYASAFAPFPTASFTPGTTRIVKIRVTYTYTGTDPAPTIQEVINAVSSNYNPSGGPSSYFPKVSGVYQFTYTDSDTEETITLQVLTKANP